MFDESKDIWALGITVLCYIFAEDQMSFYDWKSYRVRLDFVNKCLSDVAQAYDQGLAQILAESLDPNQMTRISIERIREKLRGPAPSLAI